MFCSDSHPDGKYSPPQIISVNDSSQFAAHLGRQTLIEAIEELGMFKLKDVACIGVLLVLSTPVIAQGTEEQHEACQADAYKWCPHEVPDPDEVAACLRRNMKWISPACQAQFPENQKKKR